MAKSAAEAVNSLLRSQQRRSGGPFGSHKLCCINWNEAVKHTHHVCINCVKQTGIIFGQQSHQGMAKHN